MEKASQRGKQPTTQLPPLVGKRKRDAKQPIALQDFTEKQMNKSTEMV